MNAFAKTCLVVDDSRVVRKIACKILEELGIAVREANDGSDAMTQCSETMPDIIILDWNMPNMSGMEFLKWLRGTSAGKAPKVIFCSVETDKSKIAKAIQAGANEYIMKPFDADIIREKLLLAGAL